MIIISQVREEQRILHFLFSEEKDSPQFSRICLVASAGKEARKKQRCDRTSSLSYLLQRLLSLVSYALFWWAYCLSLLECHLGVFCMHERGGGRHRKENERGSRRLGLPNAECSVAGFGLLDPWLRALNQEILYCGSWIPFLMSSMNPAQPGAGAAPQASSEHWWNGLFCVFELKYNGLAIQ